MVFKKVLIKVSGKKAVSHKKSVFIISLEMNISILIQYVTRFSDFEGHAIKLNTLCYQFHLPTVQQFCIWKVTGQVHVKMLPCDY